MFPDISNPFQTDESILSYSTADRIIFDQYVGIYLIRIFLAHTLHVRVQICIFAVGSTIVNFTTWTTHVCTKWCLEILMSIPVHWFAPCRHMSCCCRLLVLLGMKSCEVVGILAAVMAHGGILMEGHDTNGTMIKAHIRLFFRPDAKLGFQRMETFGPSRWRRSSDGECTDLTFLASLLLNPRRRPFHDISAQQHPLREPFNKHPSYCSWSNHEVSSAVAEASPLRSARTRVPIRHSFTGVLLRVPSKMHRLRRGMPRAHALAPWQERNVRSSIRGVILPASLLKSHSADASPQASFIP